MQLDFICKCNVSPGIQFVSSVPPLGYNRLWPCLGTHYILRYGILSAGGRSESIPFHQRRPFLHYKTLANCSLRFSWITVKGRALSSFCTVDLFRNPILSTKFHLNLVRQSFIRFGSFNLLVACISITKYHALCLLDVVCCLVIGHILFLPGLSKFDKLMQLRTKVLKELGLGRCVNLSLADSNHCVFVSKVYIFVASSEICPAASPQDGAFPSSQLAAFARVFVMNESKLHHLLFV